MPIPSVDVRAFRMGAASVENDGFLPVASLCRVPQRRRFTEPRRRWQMIWKASLIPVMNPSVYLISFASSAAAK